MAGSLHGSGGSSLRDTSVPVLLLKILVSTIVQAHNLVELQMMGDQNICKWMV